MRHKAFLIAATALLATAAFGQAAGPKGGAPGGGFAAGQRGKGQGQAMGNVEKGVIAKLGLTKAQNDKVTDLMKRRNDKLKAMVEKMRKENPKNANRQAFRGEFQKVTIWYEGELKTIIGTEKFKKYEALVKAERQKMAQNRAAAGGAKGKGGGKG
ncbi:MAG: hypothetical protein JST30_10080 [Armatimonadetes bacterium]|nr:hypothetical protein [Armatimonadota bacterium]